MATSAMVMRMWAAAFIDVIVLVVSAIYGGVIFPPVIGWALSFTYIPSFKFAAGMIAFIPILWYSLLIACFFALIAGIVYMTMFWENYLYGN